MARSLWICPRRAGPAAEERQRKDKEDKRTGKPTKGEGWGTGGAAGGSVVKVKEMQANMPYVDSVGTFFTGDVVSKHGNS